MREKDQLALQCVSGVCVEVRALCALVRELEWLLKEGAGNGYFCISAMSRALKLVDLLEGEFKMRKKDQLALRKASEVVLSDLLDRHLEDVVRGGNWREMDMLTLVLRALVELGDIAEDLKGDIDDEKIDWLKKDTTYFAGLALRMVVLAEAMGGEE